jgi:hypothetical protein
MMFSPKEAPHRLRSGRLTYYKNQKIFIEIYLLVYFAKEDTCQAD